MMPVPLVGGQLFAWRLDAAKHKATWNSGEGARINGGRWNSVGHAVVYLSADPATAILELAVHKGFDALDTVPHVLTAVRIGELSSLHVVDPAKAPNPNWLRPGTPSAGQQRFGDGLVQRHAFVAIPSAVSTHSWNVIFDPAVAAGRYVQHLQEPFALDTRLNAPAGQP
jgi:RES domain-containing protein